MRPAWFTIPLTLVMGCGAGGPAPKENPAEPPKVAHDHSKEGPHGGALAEWGDHEYHVEFKIDHSAGRATIYILDGEAKSARPIAAEQLTLTLKLTSPVTVSLRPEPQPGDQAKSASRFVGTHDALKQKQAFAGTVSAQVGAKRYSGDFTEIPHNSHPGEPAEPSAAQPTQREKDLFLKPGGIYTQADIERNGSIVPSVKYRGVAFDHDDNLKPGDKICPVTVNKADEKCDWWVNGKQYLFCCPPCLEKFVRQAKESPEKIKEPSEYIKK
jgi:YHS domain-containing protein